MQRHDLAQLQSAIAAAEEVGGMEEVAVMKEAKVTCSCIVPVEVWHPCTHANHTTTLHKCTSANAASDRTVSFRD